MARQQTPRHKVFISFHHDDQEYKDRFVREMGHSFVDESVADGDIDDTRLQTDTIRQEIRDQFIADATVAVVLIGPCTWQRKHVDWEIGSSLRDTRNNPRCGLLGILLPNHPDFGTGSYHASLIPPRLADNCTGDDPFARIYNWRKLNPEAIASIRQLIHTAFQRRNGNPPNNARQQFGRNRSGNCRTGWTD